MITRLVRIIRGILEDNLEIHTDNFTYSTSAIFQLSYDNANTILESLINGASLSSGESTNLDTTTNKVTVTASLTANDIISIRYNYYPNFSSTEIKSAIEASLSYISLYGITNFYYSTTSEEITPYPTKEQEGLIAILSATILKPNYSMYKLSTVDIRYPNNRSKEQKIKDVIEEYKFGHNVDFFSIGTSNLNKS